MRRLARDLARAADGPGGAEAEFWRRVVRGDYGDLLDESIRRVLSEAAAERGVATELGAVRVALARVLGDGRMSAGRQALAVSRLVKAAIPAAATQRALAGNLGGELTDELRGLVERLDRGEQEEWERELIEAVSGAAAAAGAPGARSDDERTS